MELSSINSAILKKLGKTLDVKVQKTISSQLLAKICSKLSDGKVISGKLGDLFILLQQIGIDISHINQQKVENDDDVHTYLLLDFLNLLFDALFSDNRSAFNKLVNRFGKPPMMAEQYPDGKDGTTSGAEEVDKILREARRKYGRIRSFQQKIDKENISFIPKVEMPTGICQSQVDHGCVNSSADTKVNQNVSSFRSNEIKESPNSLESSGSRSEVCMSVMTSVSSSECSQQRRGRNPRERRKKAGTKRKFDSQSGGDKVDSAATAAKTDETEVNIRIPLEEASVNVKVKRLDGQPLGNRRIHVRLQEEPEPKKSKTISYGKNSVLKHHHRKTTRRPMFSKPPPSPVRSERSVLREAVAAVQDQRRLLHQRQDEQEAVRQDGTAATANTKLSVKLENQKKLREIRTRKCQLKKMAQHLMHTKN